MSVEMGACMRRPAHQASARPTASATTPRAPASSSALRICTALASHRTALRAALDSGDAFARADFDFDFADRLRRHDARRGLHVGTHRRGGAARDAAASPPALRRQE